MDTNILYDRIYKGLKMILGRRVIIEGDNEPKAAEFIKLSEGSGAELLENTGASYAMSYSINIDLVTNRAKRSKYITRAVSNIIRALNENTALTSGGIYYWHDGHVSSGESVDDDYAARINWTATHTEIKES